MILKKVYFLSTSRFFQLSHENVFNSNTIQLIKKVLVISISCQIFSVKLIYYKNFYYKKMTEKMYGNLQKKYENIVFQILKIYKAFSNFGYNSTIRKNYSGLHNCLEIRSQGGFQINSSTYSFSQTIKKTKTYPLCLVQQV